MGRPYDELVLLGVLARWPERRHALGHVEARYFREAWQAVAWRTIWGLHDEDDAADLSRPCRLDRIIHRTPALTENARPLQAALSGGVDNLYEAAAAADRLLARWQSQRLADAAGTIQALRDQGEHDGDPRTAVEAMAAEWAEAERDIATADAVQRVWSPADVEAATDRILTERRDDPDGAYGPRSGWARWDRLHRGARPGRCGFTISPTGTGKTSFMLNLAARLCRPDGVPGLYVNLEMPQDDLVTRLAAIRLQGSRDLDALEGGTIGALDVERAATMAGASLLYVTAPSEKTAGAISALLARYAVRHGIRWACVDHLLEVSQTSQERRDTQGSAWRCHTDWVRRWHLLAQRYGFALEIVGQCGAADLGFRAGHEPSFQHMQGARAVLNHVDVARILYRGEEGDRHVVAVKKNRGGKGGVRVGFRFDAPRGTWDELGLEEESP